MSKKNRLRLFILLNCVIAVIGTAIFLKYFISAPVTSADSGNTPVYSAVRDARISLNPKISFETNIGGSGDETLCDIFNIGGRLYIIGWSDSDDCDLQGGSGAFISALSENGQTLFTRTFAQGKAVCAAIFGSGIIVGVDGDTPEIFMLNTNGDITASYIIDISDTQFCDFIYSAAGITAVLRTVTPLNPVSLYVAEFDTSLQKVYERTVKTPYTLTYLDAYDIAGTKTVFFRAKSDITDCLGAAVLSKNFEPEIKYVNLDINNKYTVYSVVPYADGYAAQISDKEGCGIMLLTRELKRQSFINYLDISPQNGFLAYGGNAYYSLFFSGGVKAHIFDTTFSQKTDLNIFGDVSAVTHTVSGQSNTLFAAESEYGLKIVGTNSTFDMTFGSKNEKNLKLSLNSDGIFAVCESGPKNGDVGGNFGKTDIWIAYIPFNS